MTLPVQKGFLGHCRSSPQAYHFHSGAKKNFFNAGITKLLLTLVDYQMKVKKKKHLIFLNPQAVTFLKFAEFRNKPWYGQTSANRTEPGPSFQL